MSLTGPFQFFQLVIWWGFRQKKERKRKSVKSHRVITIGRGDGQTGEGCLWNGCNGDGTKIFHFTKKWMFALLSALNPSFPFIRQLVLLNGTKRTGCDFWLNIVWIKLHNKMLYWQLVFCILNWIFTKKRGGPKKKTLKTMENYNYDYRLDLSSFWRKLCPQVQNNSLRTGTILWNHWIVIESAGGA